MFYHVVAVARDWAIILLALEGIILALVPFFLLFKATQQMGRFLPRVRPGLRTLHGHVIRLANGIDRVLAAIRAPFLWVHQQQTAVRAALRSWRRE